MSGVVGLAGAGGLEIFGGDAAPYLVGRNLGALQHEGAGSDNGALPYLTVIKNRGTHTDESAVMDRKN